MNDNLMMFIRYAISTGVAFAVGKGWISNDMLTAILGGGGTIFVAIWSVFAKKSA